MTSAEPRILAGRYRLDEVIGRGGMSTVYRGTDVALDRVVAVKVALDPLAEENPVYVARFKREARAAAGLTHPGIVTVFDAGADGPTRFIVMEYVRGQSLAGILRDERPLDPSRAARIADGVAAALQAAHAGGIIHRDIKPGNIMVTGDGSVKVLDFGIARTQDATITQTALVLGTAPYMSPEQALGQPADARSDIYSLGCVLYEMLTGEPPFMAEVPAGVMHQHVRVAPRPLVALNPKVPQTLNALVLQMLAKSPDDRPQTAREVRERLTKAATERAVPVPVPPPTPPTEETMAAAADTPPPTGTVRQVPPTAPTRVAEPSPAPTGSAESSPAPTGSAEPSPAPTGSAEPATRPIRSPEPRRRRALWGAVAALAALLVGAAVALAVTSGSGTPAGTTPPNGTTAPHTSPAGTPNPQDNHTTTGTTSPTSPTTSPTTPTTSPTSPTTSPTSPTTSPTATTSPTSPTTSPTSPTGTATSPAQGAVPPGQAKKNSGG